MRRLVYFPGSPFARKVRIVLAEKALEYRAEEHAGFPLPAEMRDSNPSLLVPILRDGETEVFDSNLIIDYLLATYPGQSAETGASPPFADWIFREEAKWRDQKLLATIETMANSLVTLSYIEWSGMALSGPNVLGVDLPGHLHARIASCLDYLEDQATPEGFVQGVFSVHDISLICPLLWTDQRLGFPWRGRRNLEAIVERNASRPSVTETAIPVETPNPWRGKVQ